MSSKHLRLAVFGLVASVLSSGAFAGSNSVDSTLIRLYEQVSYTTPTGMPVFGYKVELGNPGPNTQNKADFDNHDVGRGFERPTRERCELGLRLRRRRNELRDVLQNGKGGRDVDHVHVRANKAGAQIPAFFIYFTSPGAGNFVKMTGFARFAEQSDGAGSTNSTTPSTFVRRPRAVISSRSARSTRRARRSRAACRGAVQRRHRHLAQRGESDRRPDQDHAHAAQRAARPGIGKETVFFTTLNIKEKSTTAIR